MASGMEITLRQPVKLEMVDEEILTLAGCDLGFIMPGKPPQVLQVESGSEMAAHSIRTDDVLVGVDGRDTRSVAKEELEKLLRSAASLTFVRPNAEGDIEMASPRGEEASSSSASKQAAPKVAAAEAADTGARAPAAAPAAAASSSAAAPQPQAAATGSTAGVHDLHSGMAVRLINFQNEAMNGQRGKLGKFSSKQGLWQVFLETTSTSKAVRPVNLEPAPEAPAAAERTPPAAAGSAASSRGGGGSSGAAAEATQGAPPQVVAAMAALRGVVPSPKGLKPFDGPGPPPGPEWQEDLLPVDDDKESWVELLRDVCVRTVRAEGEITEPAPFHRANHWSAMAVPGQPLPEGKFPAQALSHQHQMLMRLRSGDFAGPYGSASGSWGGQREGWGPSKGWTPARRWGGDRGGKGWPDRGGWSAQGGPGAGRQRWTPQGGPGLAAAKGGKGGEDTPRAASVPS